MKSKSHISQPALFRSRSGFTLIEVIATLVLSSVVVALLLPLIGSSLQGSRRASQRLPGAHSLQTEMDAIWHFYRSTDPTDLPALSAAINDAAAENPPAPYILITNNFVAFNPDGDEIPAEGQQSVLKVTLGNSQGEQLTSYFFPIP